MVKVPREKTNLIGVWSERPPLPLSKGTNSERCPRLFMSLCQSGYKVVDIRAYRWEKKKVDSQGYVINVKTSHSLTLSLWDTLYSQGSHPR